MNSRYRIKKRVILTSLAVLLLIFFGFSFLWVTLNAALSPEIDHEAAIQPAEPTNISEKPLMLTEKRTFAVTRGDTLLNMFETQGINYRDAHEAIVTLRNVYDPRDLKPGQKVTVLFHHTPNEKQQPKFAGFYIRIDGEHDIFTRRTEDDTFAVEHVRRELMPKRYRLRGVIESSLYETATRSGLPLTVLMQLIRPFSFDVDFQRDIRPGDSFEVLYERYFDEDGKVVREGPVLYASLTLQHNTLHIYRHTTTDGRTDFFDSRGRTVRKTLLKTPIDGARLTSRYGVRKHPIQGYSLMHRGLDFASQTGTPIMASGSGSVTYMGRKGNYGKYIRIRHANSYSTAYAHLSSFARGLHQGKRVKQGDVIGYVGRTGLATGPHLHYEILYQGKQINPSRVKFPPGRKLTGKELELFVAQKDEWDRIFAGTDDATIIARKE